MRLLGEYGWEKTDPGPAPEEGGELKVSTTEPFNGERCLEIQAGASTEKAHRAIWTVKGEKLPAGANEHDYFPRIYVQVPAEPEGDVTLLGYGNFKEGRFGELIYIAATGKVQLKRNGSTVVGETAGKVAPGWHYIEMRLRFGATTSKGQIEGRVDGESFAVNNATNLGEGLSHDELRTGVCNSTGGPGGKTWRWDLMALNDDQGAEDNSWVGIFNPEDPPVVVTGEADGIGGAIATLRGKVNPRGLPTKYWFEHGPTEAYGAKTAAVEVGDGEELVDVEADLTGLTPETGYHFRLVAENAIDKTPGEDATFETTEGPSGELISSVVEVDFEAEEFREGLSEGIFGETHGTIEQIAPGYFSGHAFKATVDGTPDSFARLFATEALISWVNGQRGCVGCAIYIPVGFYKAHQGQVDLFRIENYKQDENFTQRIAVVVQSTDNLLRLVRIKEGEPDEQHTLILGPELQEGRWHWIGLGATLWHEDSLANSALYVGGVKVGESNDANVQRADYEVSRIRWGIVATSSKQTNPLEVRMDRCRVGPELVGPPELKVFNGGEWKTATRRVKVDGEFVEA